MTSGQRDGGRGRWAWAGLLAVLALAGLALAGRAKLLAPFAAAAAEEPPPVAAAPPPAENGVAALGRLQPKDGVRRIAGPAQSVAVVGRLLVDKGDRVKAGQLIALLDDTPVRAAAVERARAQLANAEAELKRNAELHADRVISDSLRDELQLHVDVARADLRKVETELARHRVQSPIDGQVLEVHARDGERVGEKGIVELGRTQEMYAVAEVYESDIGRVKLGQRARVTSPALPRALGGRVDRIGLQVGKLDALGTDPAARADARVVEVEVRLDPEDVAAAAPLTHLQVQVEIQP